MATDPGAFASAARAYCDLIERGPARERDAFLTDVHANLAALQVMVLTLPLRENDGVAAPPDAKRADRDALHEAIDLRYAALENVLDSELLSSDEEMDGTPEDLECAVVTFRVADDLADIYEDLQDGLGLLAAGREGDAVRHWRTGYQGYWGKSLLGAQSALWEHLSIDYGV